MFASKAKACLPTLEKGQFYKTFFFVTKDGQII
jgi:hypothetical protein